MPITFDRKQIVSSTDLVRSFSRYVEKELSDHDIFIFKHNIPEAVLITYNRYENLVKQLDELKELLEHTEIYEIIKQRKYSPAKEIPLEKLRKRYGV